MIILGNGKFYLYKGGENNMSILDIIIFLLVVSWLGGFAFKIGGGLIHLILVIAVIIFIARLLGFKV